MDPGGIILQGDIVLDDRGKFKDLQLPKLLKEQYSKSRLTENDGTEYITTVPCWLP